MGASQGPRQPVANNLLPRDAILSVSQEVDMFGYGERFSVGC